MKGTCINSSGFWLWWYSGIRYIFLAYTGILCTNKVSFKYRIIADNVLSWGQQCTHHLTATSRRNTLFHKPKIVTDWFMAHGQNFAALNWTSQTPALNPVDICCSGEGDSNPEGAAKKSRRIEGCYNKSMDNNVQGILKVHHWIYPKKNSGGYKAEGGEQRRYEKLRPEKQMFILIL